MNEQERIRIGGALKDPIDKRDYSVSMLIPQKRIFPKSFKYEYNKKAKDQGSVASCVGHALSYAREITETIQHGKNVDISPGFIYANRKDTDFQGKGMYTREALDNLLEFGCVEQTVFPWNIEYPQVKQKIKPDMYPKASPYKITAYAKLETIEDIQKALLELGPVPFAKWMFFDDAYEVPLWNNNWKFSRKKKNWGDANRGSHLMTIVGWREDNCFIVLNSWGNAWDNGYAYYPFDVFVDDIYNGYVYNIYGLTDKLLPTIPKKYYGKGSNGQPTVTLFKGNSPTEHKVWVNMVDDMLKQGYRLHESITRDKLKELKSKNEGIDQWGRKTYKYIYPKTKAEIWVSADEIKTLGSGWIKSK